MKRGFAVGIGLALDAILGEPPTAVHPVAAFGRAMAGLEQRWWRDARVAGGAHLAVGAATAVTAGRAADRAATRARRPGAAVIATTALAVAGRCLWHEAAAVGVALEAGDLDRARGRLPALVGRDVAELDAKGVARAAVESVAENTVDAIVAPALWAALAGSAGALGYRAVNTLDAVVGHHSARYERFGFASARADDIAGWLPARVTAVLVAAVRPSRAAAVVRAVRNGAPAHPSPNSGVAEAAFAGALGIRLGGPLSYGGQAELRPSLGAGRAAEPADIGAAITLSRHVTAALGAGLGLASVPILHRGAAA